MLKRKASFSTVPVDLVSSGNGHPKKRPRLVIDTTAKYTPPVIVPVQDNESDPSPLNWPFSDDEEAGETGVDDDATEHDSLFDTDSLFDEPTCVSVVAQDSSTTTGGPKALSATQFEATSDSQGASSTVHTEDTKVGVQASTSGPLTASRMAPPIPGLHFDSTLQLPLEVEESILAALLSTYFRSPSRSNQIMLFTLPDDTLPSPLDGLLSVVQSVMAPPAISQEVYDILFAPRNDGSTRQAIINHYLSGEGITPHVDLLGRYGDGIVGVSLGSSSAMAFAPVDPATGTEAEVYLPARSIIAMEGEARFSWTHGIPARTSDIVEGDGGEFDVIHRGTRVSVTFRWMLPGAQIVGLPADDDRPEDP